MNQSSTKNDIELPLIRPSFSKESPLPQGQISLDIQGPSKSPPLPYDPQKYSGKPPLIQWLTFTDMYSMLKQLNSKARPFEITDIPKPEFRFNVETKTQELEENWTKELQKKEPKFMRALLKTFQGEIIFAITFLFIDNATKLLYSIYVADIVKIISSPELSESRTADLLYSATMLSLLVVTSLFAKNWSLFVIHTNVARARLAIAGLLYKKLHSTSLTSLHEIKLGKVINLISNDLNDLVTMVAIPFVIINLLDAENKKRFS